jgi:hypothetical protein
MNPDLSRILAGKQAYRELLAALPIPEKLRMLEALRERTLEIAAAREGLRGETRPGSR